MWIVLMPLPEPLCPAVAAFYISDLSSIFSMSVKPPFFASCLQHLCAGSAPRGPCEPKFVWEKDVIQQCPGSAWGAVNALHSHPYAAVWFIASTPLTAHWCFSNRWTGLAQWQSCLWFSLCPCSGEARGGSWGAGRGHSRPQMSKGMFHTL